MEIWNEAIEKMEGLASSVIANLPRVGIAVLVYIILALVGKWIVKLIRKASKKTGAKDQAVDVTARLVKMGWAILNALIAVSIAIPGFSLEAMIATLGLSSIAIGFAFKDIFENFLAGLFILLKQPFEIGDVVEVDGQRGWVRDIEMRATTIETFDREMVIFPNAMLFTDPVTFVTANAHRRFPVQCGVGYETDLQQAEDIALDAIRGCEFVLSEPAPFLVWEEFGDSSINFTAYYWLDTTDGRRHWLQQRSDVVKALKAAYDANNINIPFPIRTVFMPNQEEGQAAAN